MKQTKRLFSFATALVLTFSALAVWAPGKALAATRTWDGGGSDNKFSTAENWSDDTAPVNGDVITFDLSVAADYFEEIDNDITDLSVAGITLSGTGTTNKSFEVTGNKLTLAGPVTQGQESGMLYLSVDVDLGANLVLEGGNLSFGRNGGILNLGAYTLETKGESTCDAVNISSGLKGSGAITVSTGALNLNGDSEDYEGDITVNGGGLSYGHNSLGASNTITVNGSSMLYLYSTENATFTTPIVMNSDADPALAAVEYTFRCAGGGAGEKKTITLAGPLTLNRDTIFYGSHDLKVTGTFTSNDHTLTTKTGSIGAITTSEGTIETKAQTVTIAADDKQPGKPESIGNKQTYIIDGERGSVAVGNGGVLKGAGKVVSLQVDNGGIVAPGHSPGRLTVLEQLVFQEGAVFEAELKNKDDYDQIIAGENYSYTGNAISLGNATLQGLIADGFNIGTGDTFTIIDNKHTSAVDGTFKDLPEGATFKISDGVFKITYVGGDGNDVVLSVVTVPKTPSSGFMLIFSNSYVLLAATLAVAGAAYYLSRRFVTAKAK